MARKRPDPPTEDQTATIARLVANGNNRYAAARYARVDRATFDYWYETDTEFRAEVDRSDAEAELRDVAAVSAASQNTWQAAAWRLEQRQQDQELDRLRALTT